MYPRRAWLLCAALCLALTPDAPAATGHDFDAEAPPRPRDADPGELPVPADSQAWERMRSSYVSRLQRMHQEEPEDLQWDVSQSLGGGKPGLLFAMNAERTDPEYPLLSFRFGLIRCGPGLQKAMQVLQTKKGREASEEVAAILRETVAQIGRAEGDSALVHRFNTEAGGAFVPTDQDGAPPASPGPGQPSAASGNAGAALSGIVASLSRAPTTTGEGLPPVDEPLGALQRGPVQEPPPGLPLPPISAGTTSTLTPGTQAAATKEAAKLAAQLPEDTTQLKAAVAGAEKQASPLLLDLNGNGVADTTTRDGPGSFVAEGSVWFDVAGRAARRRTEWLQPGKDGLLVLDANGNGVCDSASELFGDTDGFPDGFAKLALLDLDRDGAVAGRELAHLFAWVDDGDGHCEPSEMRQVGALGITRISVKHESYRSTFVMGGRTCRMWDWFPHWE